MSKTYPRKNLCETPFAGHISLQRRNRLQRYKKIYRYAIASVKKYHFNVKITRLKGLYQDLQC